MTSIFEVLMLLEDQTARKIALRIQSELIENGFDTELEEGVFDYGMGDPTKGINIITRVAEKAWAFHVPYDFHEMLARHGDAISIYAAKDSSADKLEFEFDGTFEMFSDPYTAVHTFIERVGLKESETDEPWKNEQAVRKAALEFQRSLLEFDHVEVKSKYSVRAVWPWANGRDPELNVDLERLSFKLKREAVVENGMKDQFGNIVLHVVIEQFVDAELMLYLVVRQNVRRHWQLYHMDTDYRTGDAANMLVHLIEYQAKKPNGERIVEESGASGHTILSRFARQLTLKGFEAEVTSKSKPGIINRSKLGIEVKGYGMKDTLKLYKPFWAHEKGMIAFVDTKTEQRFSSVEEMVEKLKARYPKLPKCLSFIPKPEKLKEAQGKLNIKQRLLQFQRELIEKLPDDTEISDFIKARGHAYGANGNSDTEFDRYVLVVKYSEHANRDAGVCYAIVIDDLDSVVVNGRQLPPSEGLVFACIYSPKECDYWDKLSSDDIFTKLQQVDYEKKDFSTQYQLKAENSTDEATTGRQEGLAELAAWLADD